MHFPQKWQQQENPNSVTATQRQSNGGNILQLLMSGRQEEIGRALGRISRQKVRIARDRLFDSALKVIGLYAAERRFLMEIEFFDEVGSGLGPTLEFYALVGREWQRLGLQMWRTDSPGSANGGDYVQTGDGLFPLTLDAVPKEVTATVLKRFRLLGMFVAKAMFDFRLIDIDFHRLFLHKVFMRSSVSTTTSVEGALVELAKVDKNLARSLRALAEEKNEDAVAEMCLDFTLPGHPNVELVPGGAVLTVTAELVPKYICALFEAVAGGGVEQQVCAFRDGFNAVFPAKALQVLGEEEIISIFSSGEWEGRWERDGKMRIVVFLCQAFNKPNI